MQIEPATCPACGSAYDPLRARAVIVVDGRVRAFCSAACRDRGTTPSPPTAPGTEGQAVIASPPVSARGRLAAEHKVLIVAGVTTLGAFVALIVAGRHATPGAAASTAIGLRRANSAETAKIGTPAANESEPDIWMQPLAGASHRVSGRDRHLFSPAREGVPGNECGGGRCAVEIEASPGDVVMAVHDGVVETVERDPDFGARRGREGRFIRIIHRGGEQVSTYLGLDGIREDLRPGIPVRAGEPIATVARADGATWRAYLRFAISLRRAGETSELFIDPQPLLTLWPNRKRAPASLHAMQPAPRESE